MKSMNSHNVHLIVCIQLCVIVPDMELNCLTDSHIKLNSLDDMQECFSNSNHKIALIMTKTP